MVECHHVLADAEVAGAVARSAEVDIAEPVGELAGRVEASHWSFPPRHCDEFLESSFRNAFVATRMRERH